MKPGSRKEIKIKNGFAIELEIKDRVRNRERN
jgi:hypothetical protein